MANLQNRTRVLYVRVSDDEFRQLRELCQKHGARNMSDLVRTSMESMARDRQTTFQRKREATFENEVTQRLRQLESSLDDIRKSMAQISAGR